MYKIIHMQICLISVDSSAVNISCLFFVVFRDLMGNIERENSKEMSCNYMAFKPPFTLPDIRCCLFPLILHSHILFWLSLSIGLSALKVTVYMVRNYLCLLKSLSFRKTTIPPNHSMSYTC